MTRCNRDRIARIAAIAGLAMALALVGAPACKSKSSHDRATGDKPRDEPASAAEPAKELQEVERRLAKKKGEAEADFGLGGGAGRGAFDEDQADHALDPMAGDKPGAMPPAPPADNAPGQARRPEGLTRAWFPETFLFEPLVVTDATGLANLAVRVPDRLTTWRVLALAHSRSGAQGGAVTSFLGTLPTYVDVVVPDTLVRGDQVRVPIQMVNTTDAAVTAPLTVAVEGARATGAAGTHTIGARSSAVAYLRLSATTPGTATVRVGLGRNDAVVKTIEVVPDGRPVVTTRSGTLAAPRTVVIEGPAGSDPATDRVRLQAFPGALALLRSELGVCTARRGVASDAYALLLGGTAPALLAALGDQPDGEALRALAIVGTQRAVRHARTLDVETATLYTEAALAHPDNPVLTRLGARAAAYLIDNQRPDGTFGGGQGWTLQRVLVATADATRAIATVPETSPEHLRGKGAAIRAGGAFERNAERIDDPYTAAAVLASGAVDGALADKLRTKLREALEASDDGARYLEVGPGVVRADGEVPSRAEATALAVLALAGDPQAPLADLGATLLGSYTPVHGWGDGRANLVAMRAVVDLFKDPIPSDVAITLTMDGKPIANGVLSRDRVREVLVLEAPAPGLAGSHTWQVTATPAVPGLGFSLALQSWVPWQRGGQGGLELDLPATVNAVAGTATRITARAVAPSGLDLHLHHGLPAGVQVDTPSLDELVSAGTITRYEVSSGALELYAPPLEPGQTFSATYRLIPTLAGIVHGGASRLEAGGHTAHVPPTTWTVR